MSRGTCRIFYATDIHGSERCFRKWLNGAKVYRPDVLIFGGDIAGKILVPIVEVAPGRYLSELHQRRVELDDQESLANFRALLRSSGLHDVVLGRDEKESYDLNPGKVATELFPQVVRDTLRAWMGIAEEKLKDSGVTAYLMLGNDDYPELEPLLQGENVKLAEGAIVDLPGGFEMISFGYSNRTPWDTPRELDEDDIAVRVDAMASQLKDPEWAVFNFHCPPKDTYIDQAPLLDETFRPQSRGGQIQTAGVGSTAIRGAMEKYAPLLGLHGHIHESPGTQKLGRTVLVNPGSEYSDGILRGVIIALDARKGVKSWQFIQG